MTSEYEDKYKWLLSKISVTDVSLWENDALITMKPIYFQFNHLEDFNNSETMLDKYFSDSRGEL